MGDALTACSLPTPSSIRLTTELCAFFSPPSDVHSEAMHQQHEPSVCVSFVMHGKCALLFNLFQFAGKPSANEDDAVGSSERNDRQAEFPIRVSGLVGEAIFGTVFNTFKWLFEWYRGVK